MKLLDISDGDDRGPVLKGIEGHWDNKCLIHRELFPCEYHISRSLNIRVQIELAESRPGALQAGDVGYWIFQRLHLLTIL